MCTPVGKCVFSGNWRAFFFFFLFLDKSNTDESCGFGHHIFWGGGASHGLWTSLSQGPDTSQSFDLMYSCRNAGTLTDFASQRSQDTADPMLILLHRSRTPGLHISSEASKDFFQTTRHCHCFLIATVVLVMWSRRIQEL